MIGHKKVMGIITMSLLVFIIAACNSSSQDVYEELSKTEITDNSPEVDDLSNDLWESNHENDMEEKNNLNSDSTSDKNHYGDKSENNNGDESEKENTYSTIERNDSNEVVKDANMIMTIGNTKVDVSWEDNDSVRELRELASSGITIQMSMYGGFEQVGSIGQRVTRNDKQTTTEPGDIVLYSGNQLVVFYGSNSWSYTRLGKINLSDEELKNLLGNGDETITLSME